MTPEVSHAVMWAVAGVAGGGTALALAVWTVARLRRPGRIATAEDAASAASAALSGFGVAGAVVGADGAGALAVADDGRVAAMRPHRRGIDVREVAWSAVRSTADGILIETGDRRLGEIALAGVDVLDIRRLAPGGMRV